MYKKTWHCIGKHPKKHGNTFYVGAHILLNVLTHILSVISVICAAHSLLSSMCGLWSVSLHNTCHLICWFASSCPVRCQWHYSVTNPIVQMWFVPWMTGTGYGRDICQFLGSGKQTSLAVFLNMIQSALPGVWMASDS